MLTDYKNRFVFVLFWFLVVLFVVVVLFFGCWVCVSCVFFFFFWGGVREPPNYSVLKFSVYDKPKPIKN